MAEAVLEPKNPIVGAFADCWAWAGIAAIALPKRVMNWRRFMLDPGFQEGIIGSDAESERPRYRRRWVKSTILAAGRPLPVFPDQRT
jgi:hypothetical protein